VPFTAMAEIVDQRLAGLSLEVVQDPLVIEQLSAENPNGFDNVTGYGLDLIRMAAAGLTTASIISQVGRGYTDNTVDSAFRDIASVIGAESRPHITYLALHNGAIDVPLDLLPQTTDGYLLPTPLEERYLRLSALGLTDGQIATLLGTEASPLSKGSVGSAQARAYSGLRARNRSSAVARLVQLKVLRTKGDIAA